MNTMYKEEERKRERMKKEKKREKLIKTCSQSFNI